MNWSHGRPMELLEGSDDQRRAVMDETDGAIQDVLDAQDRRAAYAPAPLTVFDVGSSVRMVHPYGPDDHGLVIDVYRQWPADDLYRVKWDDHSGSFLYPVEHLAANDDLASAA